MAEEKTDLSSFDEIPDRVARAKAKAEALRKARAAREGAPQAAGPEVDAPAEAETSEVPEETVSREAPPAGAEAKPEAAPEAEVDLSALNEIPDRVARARAKAEALRKARGGGGAGSLPAKSGASAPAEKPRGAPARAAAARALTAEKGEGVAGRVAQRTPAPASIRPGPPRTVPVAEGGITSRRGFLSWLVLAWVAFASAAAAGLAAVGRFMFPNVLFEPAQWFKIGFPDEYEIGVDTRWKDKYGVWIVRNTEGMYALIAICTHLGCIPNWLDSEGKFKCPCHGSGFYSSGINFEGPAPRPLERARIVLAEDGQVLVDKSRKYQYEKGEWIMAEAFLKV